MCQIGFGGWQIGGERFVGDKACGWRVGNIKECEELVERAIDLGILFFDTAQAYGDGRSEKILGNAINRSGNRKNLTVCTKISVTPILGSNSTKAGLLRRLVSKSLINLGVSYIDVLLLHNPSRSELTLDLKSSLESLINDGLIKSFGVRI